MALPTIQSTAATRHIGSAWAETDDHPPVHSAAGFMWRPPSLNIDTESPVTTKRRALPSTIWDWRFVFPCRQSELIVNT